MWMLPLYLHVNQKSDYDDMTFISRAACMIYFIISFKLSHDSAKITNIPHSIAPDKRNIQVYIFLISPRNSLLNLVLLIPDMPGL